MKKNFFSIIVPCYNVEKYVTQCIDSILSQTENDYEIIIINDGSKDNTLSLLKKNYSNNGKIIILDQKNGGLSNARNNGIKHSSGEYLMFVDSDDYWNDNNALKELKNYIQNELKDVVVIGNTKFYENNEKLVPKNNINYSDQGIHYLLKNNYFKACAWDKVVKSNLIKDNSNYFPNGLLSEDIIWCGKLLEQTKNIGCYENNFYMYRQRNDSITKTVKEKNILDMIQMISYFKNSKDEIINSFLAYEYSVALGLISSKNVKKTISKETKNKLFTLSYLLEYDLNDKVKKVKTIYKLFGIKITSIILGIFIDIK